MEIDLSTVLKHDFSPFAVIFFIECDALKIHIYYISDQNFSSK